MRLAPATLVTLLAVCLLVTQASAQTPATIASPDATTLRGIESQVSQIRGLQPMAEPELRLLDHTSLHDYLADEFARNYLPGEREADQKELVALGLIQPTDDIVQIELNLLTDQVVGVYDPDVRALFVVNDAGGFGPAARLTYAHEFNHALQDQYYNLNRIAPKHPDSNDHSLAVHALIEGDAIMLQSLWAQQNLSQDDLVQLARGSVGADDSLGQVPLIVRTELLFPYTAGFNFVRLLFHDAGNSYSAVDSAFLRPPQSTAQILHVDKYRDQVAPVDVPLGDIASGLGAEWRMVGSGVLGELDTRVLLEQWGTSAIEADRVASAWSGDHWQLVEKDSRTAIALRSTWATPAAASDFFSAYARGLRTRFSSAEVQESSATRQALTTPVAATDLRVEGSDVVAVIAFDRDSADGIMRLIAASAS